MAMDSVFRVSLILDMVDNMTSKVQGAASGVPEAVQGMNNAFGSMQKAGAVMTGMGTAITTACLSTAAATFDTQDALAEVSSLGVKDLATLEAAAKNFSDTWAGTTKSDFISASYDIKSGIASLTDEGVAQYTELAGLTAKATKATTADMTSLFATGYGIYKGFYSDLSDMEFGEMFSAGIATAVKNYKTSGTQMADSIKTLGASATNANVPMEEQLAILGQLQATMSGSEAGTKYKAFLNAAVGAGSKLGLTFTDSNNQLLSMPEILEKLHGKYGDTIDAMEKKQLKEAFGTDEAIALIDLLYNNTDQLKTGIEDLQTSMDNGISETEQMAEAINNTPAQKFELLKQQMHNATEELGRGLLPGINNTLDAVSTLVQRGSDWVANNQETVSTIMNIVMYLGIFLIAAGTLAAVIGTLGKAMTSLSSVTKLAQTATSGFGGVLLKSPIAWAVAAILGLIAVFKACGGDASQLGTMFQSAFSKIRSVVQNVLSAVMAQLPGFLQFGLDLLANIINGIASGLPDLISAGSMAIQGLLGGITQMLPQILSAGGDLLNMLLQSVLNGLPSLMSAGTSLIESLVGGITQMLPALITVGLSLLQMLLSGIVQNLPALVTAGMSLIESLVGGITQLLPVLLTAGMALLQMVVSGIAQNLPSLITAGISMIQTILSGLLEALPQLLSAVIQMIPMIVSGIAGMAPSLISGGISIIAAILEGIITAVPAVIGMIPELFGQVVDSVMSIDWISVGGELVDGIKDGFVEGFAGLVDSAKGLWDNFTGWLTGGGGAEEAVSEMADGIETELPRVENAVTDLNSTIEKVSPDTAAMQQKGAEAIQAVTAGFADGAGDASGAAAESAQNIMAAFNIDTSGAGSAGTDLMDSVLNGILDGTGEAAAAAAQAGNDIMSSFNIDTSGAGNAGADLMGSIMDGIAANTGAATSAADSIMQSLNDGLSCAAESGTTAMSGIGEGISSGTGTATGAMSDSAKSIMDAFTNATASASSLGNSMMQKVASGIRSGGSAAVSAANSIVSSIRSAFANMSITVPAPKLPHVSVSYSTVGSGDASAQVPNFSVSYYAEGGIMTRPTLFGMNGNKGMIGGEAGDEAILPLSTLWTQMRTVVGDILVKHTKTDVKEKTEPQTMQKELVARYQAASETRREKTETLREKAKGVMVQTLNLYVDFSDIDEIDKLRELIADLEGDEDPIPAT